MNKIIIIGNLTRDPESRATPSGATVCSFTIAVNRRFAGKGEERQTDFFRINAWRGLADNCQKYLAKGKKAAVIGELQPRAYKDKDGNDRMSLEINADEVEFLSDKGTALADPKAPKNASGQEPEGWEDISSDDIPF